MKKVSKLVKFLVSYSTFKQMKTIGIQVSRIKFKKSREKYLKTKISHRTFGGCESGSQIGSDRKFRKSQISISKQMYRTVTMLMEK